MCTYGHNNTARMLIDRGANIPVATCNGNIPLHFECLRAHQETSLILIDRGANQTDSNNDENQPLN